MKKQILSIILILVLVFSTIPVFAGVAAQGKTIIHEIEVISEEFDIRYGMMKLDSYFKTVKGAPAYLDSSSNNTFLRKYDGTNWKRVAREEILTEGTYMLEGDLLISQKDYENYAFQGAIKLTINGKVFLDVQSSDQEKRTYFFQSEFTITKPTHNYTVSFNANGGTGTMTPASYIVGGYKVPTTCNFTAPKNCEFAGWKLSPTDEKYVVNTVYVDRDITLYAMWEYKNGVWIGGVNMQSGDYLAQNATKTTTTKPKDNYAYLQYSQGTYRITLHNYSYTGKGYNFYNPSRMLHIDGVIAYYLETGNRMELVFEGTNNLVYNGDSRQSGCIYDAGLGGKHLKIMGNKDSVLNLSGATYGINVYLRLLIQSGEININCKRGISSCQDQFKMTGGKLKIDADANALEIACREESYFTNCEATLISRNVDENGCALEINPYGDPANFRIGPDLTVIAATDSAGTKHTSFSINELESFLYLQFTAKPYISVNPTLEPIAGKTATKKVSVDTNVDYRVREIKWLDENGSEFTGTFQAGKKYTFQFTYQPIGYLSELPYATVGGNIAKHVFHDVDRVGRISWTYTCPEYYWILNTPLPMVGHGQPQGVLKNVETNCSMHQSYVWTDNAVLRDSVTTFEAGKTYYLVITLTPEGECAYLINDTTPKHTYIDGGDVELIYTYTMPNVIVPFTSDSNPTPGGTVTVDLEAFAEQDEGFTEAYFNDEITVAWYADGEKIEGQTDLSYTIPENCTASEIYAVVTALGKDYSHAPFKFNTVKQGDVNADGDVKSDDALLALQKAVSKVELTKEQFAVADVNVDGTVTSSDALLILQFAVNKITEF